MSRLLCVALALMTCCSISGCGYRLAGRTETAGLITDRTIAIPILANKSYRANLETILTTSLIDEFARRSGGKVMAENEADLVLEGAVVSYGSVAVSYTAADRVLEYRSSMTMDGVVRERKTSQVLWKGTLTASQVYPASSVISLQQNSEDAAIREICHKLARKLHQQLKGDF